MTWTEIMPGVLERQLVRKNLWSLRSTAIALEGGGVCVLSPTRQLDPEELRERAGPTRFLFATNHFHYVGIPRWLEKFPDARVISTEVARPRLMKKLGLEPEPAAALSGALPAGVRVLIPEGVRSGEAWVEVSRGDERVWVVTDAFFSIPKLPTGAMGLFSRATGMAPGLAVGATWKYLQLRERSAYRDWVLAKLADTPPTMIIPAHGDIVRGADLGKRLTDIVRRRL